MLRVLRTHLFFKRTLKTCGNILKSPAADIDISKNVVLQEYVFEKINRWSDRIALECIETKRRYTYLELRTKTLSLTHFLKNSLKLEEKSCVGILLPNLPEYPIIVLACVQAGLQISPINPNYTQDEIKKQLVNSKAKVLFALAERENEVRNICDDLNIPVIAIKINQSGSLSTGTINFFDQAVINRQNVGDIYTKNISVNDVVLLPFSSGTTGLPKGVQLTHNNLVSNLKQCSLDEFNFYKRGQDERVLAFLPFFHIYGMVMVLFHGLAEGVKLITIPKFSSHYFLEGLRHYRPTFIPSVPPIVHLINTNPNVNHKEDLASLTSMICGAAPLGETDVLRFKELTQGKIELLQAYGMTETSPLNVIQTSALEGGVKIGGSGFVIANTEAKFISIDSDSQEALNVNQSGQLLIRGPQVMKGYLDNPEATKDIMTEDGFIKTGDIGHYDEDGHIFITDRLKELIKVQGFPVAPAELEAVIRNHPSVEDVAVIGVQHDRLGEVPKAFVVQKKTAQVKAEEIQQFVNENVAKHKRLVGGVTFLESIPKTPSGKILRRELKKAI